MIVLIVCYKCILKLIPSIDYESWIVHIAVLASLHFSFDVGLKGVVVENMKFLRTVVLFCFHHFVKSSY